MLSEVKLGLLPATISPYVIRRIGANQCRRYFLTAEPFPLRREKCRTPPLNFRAKSAGFLFELIFLTYVLILEV